MTRGERRKGESAEDRRAENLSYAGLEIKLASS